MQNNKTLYRLFVSDAIVTGIVYKEDYVIHMLYCLRRLKRNGYTVYRPIIQYAVSNQD